MNILHLSYSGITREETFPVVVSHLEVAETEVPVPDRLFRKSTQGSLINSLKLSQRIGLLLWLNSQGLISEGGKERLVYLQRKASFECLSAAIRFTQRITTETKLQADFRPHMNELNRRPQSKRFRISEKRRIGVGYRDKGTLPELSSSERLKATEESFINSHDIPDRIYGIIQHLMPEVEEDDWIDLEEVERISFEINQRLPGLIQFLTLF